MRFTIKLKLGLAFAVVVLLSGATAWLGISNLSTVNESLGRLVEGPMKRLELSQRLSIGSCAMKRI